MNPLPDGYTLESVAASACPHADARQAAAIAEACFQSAHDPTQMPIDDATVTWLLDTVPAYWNLIKYRGAVIGSTLILPTSRVLMQGFCAPNAPRRSCGPRCGGHRLVRLTAAILAGAALRASHRRRGLALASLQASLDYFLAHDHPRPDVYCWVYSEDGRWFLSALRCGLAARGLDLLERQSVAATG
ncbi:MAG: hypothetical protein RKO25_09875 [Candidatus Contendobacter sp.]|nr:hypothetical protein [Candidatus Contendobacter sp.]